MTPPTDPAGIPDSPFPSRDDRAMSRRVLAVAFGVSILIHLVLILLYPALVTPPGATGPVVTTGEPSPPQGSEIVRITERPEEEELERPEEPEVDPRPEPARPPGPAAPGDEEAGPREGDEEPGLSAARRIRATVPDARLLAPLSDEVVSLSPEQIAQLELIWALETANDSAATAAERARRATDWTYTDSEGKRWGVSPGMLHLGDVTIPLPTFGAPYDPEAWKGSLDADILRTAGSAAAREAGEDRARAIRERKEREQREKADTTGGGGG